MLARQQPRLQRRQLFQNRRGLLRVREIIQRPPKRLAHRKNLPFRHRRVPRSALSEQIAAEKRSSRNIEQHSAVPPVRYVRGGQPHQFPRSCLKSLSVLQTRVTLEQIPAG